MATEAGKFLQYAGPLSQIPATSPGLVLLSQYLPAIDALDRSSEPATKLKQFLLPEAVFITNGGPPVPAAQVLEMLKMRQGMLENFYHKDEVKVTEMAYKDGKRSLICETTSV